MTSGAHLDRCFFSAPVLEVARSLIGCRISYGDCSGVIVETEAYHHSEPACHGYSGPTARSSVLFERPGTAYVYRSYGIHALLNAVVEPEGIGAAVLIRALEPLSGIASMCSRRKLEKLSELCSGPGKLTQALGIELDLNGSDLLTGPLVFQPPSPEWEGVKVVKGPRVGISKATDLPWRFCVAGNLHVSRPRLTAG